MNNNNNKPNSNKDNKDNKPPTTCFSSTYKKIAKSEFGRWIRSLYGNPNDPIFWRRNAFTYVVEIALTGLSLFQLSDNPPSQKNVPTAFYAIGIIFVVCEIPLIYHFWNKCLKFYNEMKQIFDQVDTDHDGIISSEQMNELVKTRFIGYNFELNHDMTDGYKLDDATCALEHDNTWSLFFYHYFEFSSMWLWYLASLMTYDAARGMRDINNALSVTQGIVSVFDIWLLLVRATSIFYNTFIPQTKCIEQFNRILFLFWMTVIIIALIVVFAVISAVVIGGAAIDTGSTNIDPVLFPGLVAGGVTSVLFAFIVCSLGFWLRCLSCSCIGLLKRRPRHRGVVINNNGSNMALMISPSNNNNNMSFNSNNGGSFNMNNNNFNNNNNNSNRTVGNNNSPSSRTGFIFSAPPPPSPTMNLNNVLQYDPSARGFTQSQ
jgi:hypothetical protein